MSIGKRVTYLKGLAEGLGLGKDSKEERLLHLVIDILEDITLELEDLGAMVRDLDDDIGDLVEDVQDLEALYDEELVPETFGGQNTNNHAGGVSAPLKAPQFYAVECPQCSNELTVDEDILDLGSVDCPNCGENLEFDLED